MRSNRGAAVPPGAAALSYAGLAALTYGKSGTRSDIVHCATVPLYYFHIYNDDITLDPEGTELADDEAAMALAVIEVRGLASETVRNGHFIGFHRIEVVGEDRRPVGKVRFDEAVTIG